MRKENTLYWIRATSYACAPTWWSRGKQSELETLSTNTYWKLYWQILMGKYATGFFLQKGMCAQHHSVLKFSSNYVPTYLLTNLLTYILSSGQEVLGLASAEMPYTLVACAYLVDGGTYSHNQKWSYIIALRASIDRVSTWTDQENTPADHYGDRSRAWNQSRWHIAAGHHKIFADWTQCAQMKYYKHTILSEQICQCESQLRLI